MYALYITHPQVRIDPKVPVPEWGLSDIGAERARRAFSQPWARDLRRIVSSTETKAIETAQYLARASGLEVETVEDMHENDRSATGFLPPDLFEKAADWFFAHPHASYKGWETAADAQARIVKSVETILATHDPASPLPSSVMARSEPFSKVTSATMSSDAAPTSRPAVAIFSDSILRTGK